ncbi:MAG: hypothetical protein M9913_00685 [Bryobacteraceae bacterium]|nr:glycosyltransferase [Solibacteraceae bacterium]MCO5349420.1 hypothetical protein [Bryobacteraceae bacterium]
MIEAGGIVQVSDISVGHGNFDSVSLIRSLCELYGLPGVILEPDQPEKPLADLGAGLSSIRIPVSGPFRSQEGRVEFVYKTAEWIDRLKPRILVIRCSWNIPVLYRLKRKAPLVLYHATESTTYYGDSDAEFNRHAADWIDAVIFPEENRAKLDIRRCGFEKIPVAIAYNSPLRLADLKQPVEASARNGKIMYSGALDVRATFVEYYANPRMQAFPVDIYGYVGGSEPDRTQQILQSAGGRITYRGFVSSAELERARPNYSYGLTIWNPDKENQRYACPCKFFESIAAGVPVITAPHPQPGMLVSRYRCGLVMEDWSLDGMLGALKQAMRIYGTAEYASMVANCHRAMKVELNWDRQFERVKAVLPSRLPGG